MGHDVPRGKIMRTKPQMAQCRDVSLNLDRRRLINVEEPVTGLSLTTTVPPWVILALLLFSLIAYFIAKQRQENKNRYASRINSTKSAACFKLRKEGSKPQIKTQTEFPRIRV